MSEGMFTDTNYLMARKMMDYTTLRQEALSSNLANVEVPGYKRIDVSQDFQTELRKAVESGSTQAINDLQLKTVKDENSISTRADGNNVQMDREMMEMNRNSVDYDYVVHYLNYDYQLIKSAIASQ